MSCVDIIFITSTANFNLKFESGSSNSIKLTAADDIST